MLEKVESADFNIPYLKEQIPIEKALLEKVSK